MPNTTQSDSSVPERLERVADLVEIAGRLKASTVVVAGGDRVDDLRLVESARDHGIVDRIILVGNAKRIEAAVAEVGIEISSGDIVAAENDDAVAAATVELVKAGEVDVAMKGNISTPIINRHMLPLAMRSTVSLTSVFDAAPIANGRPMVLTDAGVTTVCNFGRMVDLVRNAVDVAHVVMGIERPRVAILSANEKQVPSLPSTWMGAELARRAWPDAIVYGPLSFDLATDPESVRVKGLPDVPNAHEVAGQADVLVCPGIDAANVLYKTITAMIKYGDASLAGITMGFPVSYTLISRADTVASRLESIALCCIYAQRTREAGRVEEAQPGTVAPEIDSHRVAVINPGSTSLKIAVFENSRCVNVTEEAREIPLDGTRDDRANTAAELTQTVRRVLDDWDIDEVDAVVGRGGFLPRPADKLQGGTYIVAREDDGKVIIDEAMVSALLEQPEKPHASNLGIPVAALLAEQLNCPAYAVDPVVVDEFAPEAELSGYAAISRRSTSHALSIRAAARKAAKAIGRPLDDVKLVVAHLGGGITVAAVRQGKMVDNSIALLGEGPFSPQRTGQLPLDELIALCYSGRFTQDELCRELSKRGGLRSYLDEDRMEIIEERIAAGDEHAWEVVNAMIYQIAKEIGAMFVVAGCDVEAIVLTGGLTRNERIRTELRRRVGRLAPVMVFQESLEMEAMAAGAVDVLAGREKAMRYVPPDALNNTGELDS